MKKLKFYLHRGLCPACGSGMIGVTKTDSPVRSRKCKVCAYRWNTIEVVFDKNFLPNFLNELIGEGCFQGYDKKMTPHIAAIASLATGGRPLRTPEE